MSLSLSIVVMVSSFLMIYSFVFASMIPMLFHSIRSKKLHDFRIIFFVYHKELIASVIILMSVNGQGPTIHHISFMSYRSTRSTSFLGNMVEVLIFLSIFSMIVFSF